MSQSLLFVNSPNVMLDTSEDGGSGGGDEQVKETTSTMLVLMNAVAECRNKNVKKATVEFTESYNATCSNDDLFISKLLELKYVDLELLYQTICSAGSRRSSKQQEKKSLAGSFKKKSSVGDSSFANAAFEGEMRSSTASSSSLGRKRSQISLSEESIQGKACLRKAYKLRRDILNTDCQNTQNDAFLNAANIHLKGENYYSCTVLCVDYKEKFTVEGFLCTLDDVQVTKLSEVCLLIATKETSGCDVDSRIAYSKLAVKLKPNSHQAAVCLCNLYRMNNETEKAFSTVKVFLEEVNPAEEQLLLLQAVCLTDTSKYALAKSYLEEKFQTHQNYPKLAMVLSIVYILCNELEKGLELIEKLEIHTDKEKKKMLVSVLELFKAFNLQTIVKELYSYVTSLPASPDPVEKKAILFLAARMLAYKTSNHIEIAKLYVDCLYVCGELDTAQDFLVKLVKDYPQDTLPMVYLANIRLKVGAYVASTEDFRALLKLYGEENLMKDLVKLPLEERQEIARVHRLHGGRFLANELKFREASECFTVVLCAIGHAANGLCLSRGYCYMHLNDFKAAEKDFNDCVQNNELLTTAALCARAVLYAVTTHVEEALRDFKQAFSIDPVACQKCLPKLPFEHVTVFSQMVIQYIKQGIENATVSNKKLRDISEISVMETTSMNTANTTSELEKDILGYSEFLCKVFPTNTDYVSTYIECLHLKHANITRKIAIDRALAAFPGEPRFKIWKGVQLAAQRKLDDTIDQIKDICNENDDTLHILSYFKQKARKQIFERSMKKGRKAIEKENYEAAVSYFTLASSLFTNDVVPVQERFECYSKTGDEAKWLTDLNRILTLDPSATYYCMRAVHYQHQGDHLNACEDYMKALEVEEKEALKIVTMNGNVEDVTRLFHTTALSMCDINKTRVATKLCETGLQFDPSHKGLRNLMEKSTMSRCVIQ